MTALTVIPLHQFKFANFFGQYTNFFSTFFWFKQFLHFFLSTQGPFWPWRSLFRGTHLFFLDLTPKKSIPEQSCNFLDSSKHYPTTSVKICKFFGQFENFHFYQVPLGTLSTFICNTYIKVYFSINICIYDYDSGL